MKMQQLVDELERKKIELSSFRRELDAKVHAETDHTRELTDVKRKLSEQRDANSELEGQLLAIVAEVDALKRERHRWHSELALLTEQTRGQEQAERRVEVLSSGNKQLEAENAALKKRLDDTLVRLDSTTSEMESLAGEVDKLRSTCSFMRQAQQVRAWMRRLRMCWGSLFARLESDDSAVWPYGRRALQYVVGLCTPAESVRSALPQEVG
jgi:chromosome segregation ATPase